MLRPNADITVVRLREGQAPACQEITGVFWQQIHAYTTSGKGVVDSSDVFVSIPKAAMTGQWPIRKGDYIVRATGLDFKDTGRQLRYTLEDLGAVLVQSIDDFLDVGIKRPHLELRCV